MSGGFSGKRLLPALAGGYFRVKTPKRMRIHTHGGIYEKGNVGGFGDYILFNSGGM
jgi:hypothetical protein